MKIPSIKSKLPDALEFKDIVLEPPTADMPVFPPIVIPPGNIKAPAGVELEEIPAETEEEEEETTTTEPERKTKGKGIADEVEITDKVTKEVSFDPLFEL